MTGRPGPPPGPPPGQPPSAQPPPGQPPEEPADLDRGAAEERTRLAWLRTTVSFAAVGGAILKLDPPAGAPLLAMAAGVWLVGPQRGVGPPGRPARSRRRALRLITLMIVATVLVALVVCLLPGGAGRGLTVRGR
ncbi:DUF202 domain-containing protein [Kitasatospora sp. NBC_01266]|uniref:DUF202 domain-containing protein n=1 Tax=Kitasatospora sp. NBC_01266 TaxID=2903572 RepID=UPI002E2EE13D|nr:DUF202 domain-containing protein [Kitasatospora sp. NBC_01266]